MSRLVWYRSLYWRIAVGLVLFLALMLGAQAGAFLWMSNEIAGSMPARSPVRLAFLIASDIGAAFRDDPALDLEAYVQVEYGHIYQGFVVVMASGQVVANHGGTLPENIREEVLAEMARRGGDRRGDPRRGGDRGSRGAGPQPDSGDPRADSGAAGLPRLEPGLDVRPPGDTRPLPPEPYVGANILVTGERVGRVAIMPGGPLVSVLLTELGPTIGLVGGALLFVGSTLIALLVFGPARRRLAQLRDATVQLGSGDLTARAQETGGDEVASLAHSFNNMGEELALRAHALEQSNRARRQLLADVSHELMTPLTAMRGYVETLTMPELAIDRDTRDRYLGIIDKETNRLERIIGDLLDLARLEGGGLTLSIEPVEIEDIFARVAERHERELSQRGIQLIRRIAPDAQTVVGDSDRLEQDLQNLAANALRHTQDGGTITLDATVGDKGILVSLRDTGPGIAPEHLPLIFDRFYKVDAARKASGGSGLGLSIVRAIVERHGGTISARSDHGAIFEITLPRTASA